MAVVTLATLIYLTQKGLIGSICIGFPKVTKVSTGALAFDGIWSANLANVNKLIEYILANKKAHHFVMQNVLIDGSTEKVDI